MVWVSGGSSVFGQATQEMHLRMVFFTPSDIEPPAGAEERMQAIADYTQGFFGKGMARWGYEPAIPLAIERDDEGGGEDSVGEGPGHESEREI
jgi:hypothetical protein